MCSDVDDHRVAAESDGAERSRKYLIEAAENEERHVDAYEHRSVADDLGLVAEQRNQRLCQTQAKACSQYGYNNGNDQGVPYSLFHSLKIVLSVVLADKSRGCKGHALDGGKAQRLDLAVCGLARQNVGPEIVDVGNCKDV